MRHLVFISCSSPRLFCSQWLYNYARCIGKIFIENYHNLFKGNIPTFIVCCEHKAWKYIYLGCNLIFVCFGYDSYKGETINACSILICKRWRHTTLWKSPVIDVRILRSTVRGYGLDPPRSGYSPPAKASNDRIWKWTFRLHKDGISFDELSAYQAETYSMDLVNIYQLASNFSENFLRLSYMFNFRAMNGRCLYGLSVKSSISLLLYIRR
jgi:hypothetical protein